MGRVERQGHTKLLEFSHGAVMYTIMIIHDRVAAYEATGLAYITNSERPAIDPVSAAKAAFATDSDLDTDDKWFIDRWLELVGASGQTTKPRPEEDPEPGSSVVTYGKLEGV